MYTQNKILRRLMSERKGQRKRKQCEKARRMARIREREGGAFDFLAFGDHLRQGTHWIFRSLPENPQNKEREREREFVSYFSIYIYIGHWIFRSLPENPQNKEREREREFVSYFSIYIYIGHGIFRSLPEISRNRERERERDRERVHQFFAFGHHLR